MLPLNYQASMPHTMIARMYTQLIPYVTMFAQDRWFSTCTLAIKTGCHGKAENVYQWHKALLKQIRLQWEHEERQYKLVQHILLWQLWKCIVLFLDLSVKSSGIDAFSVLYVCQSFRIFCLHTQIFTMSTC
jgi:hypothetical protein